MKLSFRKWKNMLKEKARRKMKEKKRRRKGLGRLASCSTDGKINLEV